MLEICIQTSYDQIVQLMLKSYLPAVFGRMKTKPPGYSISANVIYAKWVF